MARKQEEMTKNYLEEIKQLTEEKSRLEVERQKHEIETAFAHQEGTLVNEMHIYKKKEREMKAKEEENNKKLSQLQQALHAEKNRFRYAEVSLHDGTRNPDAPVY